MASEHAQGPRRQHHLALPFGKARLPERQGRRFGQLAQADRGPSTGQGRAPSVTSSAGPAGPSARSMSLASLHALRPLDEVEPGSAKQPRHVGPERAAGAVVVAAPNEPLCRGSGPPPGPPARKRSPAARAGSSAVRARAPFGTLSTCSAGMPASTSDSASHSPSVM